MYTYLSPLERIDRFWQFFLLARVKFFGKKIRIRDRFFFRKTSKPFYIFLFSRIFLHSIPWIFHRERDNPIFIGLLLWGWIYTLDPLCHHRAKRLVSNIVQLHDVHTVSYTTQAFSFTLFVDRFNTLRKTHTENQHLIRNRFGGVPHQTPRPEYRYI